MAVPSSLASLSQTPGSNSPAGSDTVFPSLDDYLREIFADLARLRDGAQYILTGVSGTNTITASCAQITSFAAGQVFAFVSAGANTTTTVTLNINSIGAKNVLRPGGGAMAVGDIPASGLVVVGYNGTNFEHLNCKHVALADSATSATSATNASNVPWSGVSSTPTTLGGYGIGDAVASSSFTGANQSLSGPGYQKLPGGLIFQWGVSTTNASGNGSVTYPISFPTACLHFSAAARRSYVVNNSVGCAGSPGSSSASVYADTASVIGFDWFAIGY